MIMDLSGARVAPSPMERIVDAMTLGRTGDLCCDYPPRPCCWDDRSARPKTRASSMLRGVRGVGLLGPIDTAKAKPWLILAGLVLGGYLATKKR